MARARHTNWRQVAAEIALLAMVVFSTVVAWHTASRTLAAGLRGQVEAQAFCHSGTGTESASEQTPSDTSGLDCPVCSALAGLSLAFVPVCAPIGHPEVVALSWPTLGAMSPPDTFIASPRNRGPPRLI